jgi:hypothetical protein
MLEKLRTYNAQIRAFKTKTPGTADSYKYYKRWKKTLDRTKTSLDYGLPWFTFQAIDLVASILKPGMRVFEFGGGGSSVFFLNRNCEVYTVEHNVQWFSDIEKYVQHGPHAASWHGYLIEPAPGNLAEKPAIGDPLHYHSKDADYASVNFKDYASRIDAFENSSFDLVLVDGRARPSCVYHAVSKIKSGGYLVLDNTERDYYLDYFNSHFAAGFTLQLDVFGPVPYIDWFHKTTVWKKN